jgi:hypothetical protein
VTPFETPSWGKFFKNATGVDTLDKEFVERPVFGQRVERELATDPGEMVALTTKDWKYIHEPEVGDKLFDRKQDPFELVNLLEAKGETAGRMHKVTMLLRAEQERRGAELGQAAETEVDPELLEQLRKIGYAGGDDGRSRFEDGEPAPRPPESKEPEVPESEHSDKTPKKP